VIKVNKNQQILNFYGINFYNWSFKKIIKKINKGGYLVAPAASALINIKKNPYYYESLKKSSIAIFDSGFFCILLRLFKIFSPNKFSGYLFLNKFLGSKNVKNKKIFLINASNIQSKKNLYLLQKNGFKKIFLYTAPIYNKNIKDLKVVNKINRVKPNYVIINIAGKKQEPLAYFLTKKTKFKISIFCLGAAIDFQTRLQAPINIFWDRIYMGWLIRLIFNPLKFFKRTFSSLRLIFFFKKTYFNI